MSHRILNLTFHGIGDPPPHAEHERIVWLRVDEFEAVLDAVRERGDVRLSFDDANITDSEVAVPALRARGLTATFFLPVGRLGTRGFLTRDGVNELVNAGMSVGSHGISHRPWRTLTDAQLDEELVRSRARLEEIAGQRVVAHAAAPFGRYDRRVLGRLRAAGYARVFTSDGGWARPDAWVQPRNTIERGAVAGVLPRLASGRPPYAAEPLRPLKRWVKRWR